MSQIKNILLIANSARMLAQFATVSGYKPLVIDCYSDVDTQELALDCIKVRSLALEQVKNAFSILIGRYKITHCIYGSGLERHLNTLEFLQQNLIVLGNTLNVFSAVQDKSNFFSRLSFLQIPHPESTFHTPEIQNDWLIKPLQGEGGIGIKRGKDSVVMSQRCYWQKYLKGKPSSVLFVANGTDYRIIGFHRQTVIGSGEHEFVFSGVSTYLKICDEVRDSVNIWLSLLVSEFSLKGINSLDFIENDSQCQLLEINARPSASMQLYRRDLLSLHINSFLLGTIEPMSFGKAIQAFKVVYAETDFSIRTDIKWPKWVVDRPQAGSLIHTATPICSIIAGGKKEQKVKDLLLLRQEKLKKLLK